ncbi:cytochrome c [Mesonia hippocampi]|uniref:Cytochrome c n=1 Tax=Mesonia hippocampi TaxID=1628250 RepID=A0A840ERB8_9FLAO|nr:hypothetical protein [Mesonia hippocampi]MBB4117896.1 cytochrome c [Mesonia hippocampi]
MNIQQTLRYSTAKYNRLIIETYIAYCSIQGVDDKDVQKILANTAYFNWFLQEYRILEAEFLEEVEPYLRLSDIEAVRNFYDEKTCQIAEFFSKTLLQKARSLQIINHNPQLN